MNIPTLPSSGAVARAFVACLSLALLFSRLALAQTQYTINTYAGGGPNNLEATAIPLEKPDGVAVDLAGNVYVSVGGMHRVYRITLLNRLELVAGFGSPGNSGDNGPATIAGLNNPAGLALDASGNLYIADRSNHRVRRVDSQTGIITTVAGTGVSGYSGDGGVATNARLNEPAGVAVDNVGNLYIADSKNWRARKVLAGTNIIQTIAGNGNFGHSGDGGQATAAQFKEVMAVAVDIAWNVYLADAGNHMIRRVTAAGVVTRIAGNGLPAFGGDDGPATNASLNRPTGVSVDANGDIFISDDLNNRIRKVWMTTGQILTVAGGGISSQPGDDGPAAFAKLNQPSDVAADAFGNLFIADYSHHRVRKIFYFSEVIQTIGGTGAATATFAGDGSLALDARLESPMRTFRDAQGDLYIADRGNHRIRKVDANGGITTVAGSDEAGYEGDGRVATSAKLRLPSGIVVDPGGNIYFAEQGNHAIRKVNVTSGFITTVAGNGQAGFGGDGLVSTAARLNNPSALALDNNGNLYVADQGNHRIRKIDAATKIISTVAGTLLGYSGDLGPATEAKLNSPGDVLIDGAGNLFIADTNNHVIRKVGTNGRISTIAGVGQSPGFSGDGGPATFAKLDGPQGIGVDATGNVLIADTNNHRLRRVGPNNIIETIGGAPGQVPNGFGGDGRSALLASFDEPRDIEVDSTGTLYVTDYKNDRVRALSPCTYSLLPNNVSMVQGGGTGDFRVFVSGNNCAWTASSEFPWLVLTGGVNGTGSGTLSFTVTPNSGAARTGTITAGAATFTVNQAAAPASACTYTLNPSTINANAAGASGALQITAQGTSCAWTAGSNTDWAQLGVSSGVGSGSVQYTIAANSLASSRSALFTIAGQQVQVSQAAAAVTCVYTVTPATLAAPAPGLTGVLNVTVQGTACSWTAASDAAWVQLTPSSGTVSGTVTYQVSPNSALLARNAVLTVAGKQIPVTQAAAVACAYTVTPATLSAPALGLTGVLNLTVQGTACSWTAASDAAWVQLTPSSGTVSGAVTYQVSPNIGLSSRTAILTVAGKQISVNQAGAVISCGYAINPTSVSANAIGDSGTLALTTLGTQCPWTVSSPAGWLQVTPASGTGSATLQYSVSANQTGALRTAKITAAGAEVTFNQPSTSSPCVFGLANASAAAGAEGQRGTVQLISGNANCTWAASSNASWVQVYPLSGTGGGDIEYTVFPNFSAVPRSARVTIGGQSFNVNQTAGAGTPNERFIRLLYFNFFGRLPAQKEVDFQIGNTMNKGMTRADIVVNFFNSLEFNTGGRFIAGIYLGLLNRDAEYGGWLFQRNALTTHGMTQHTLVSNFINSAEWKLAFGTPSDAEYVRLLYRYVLLRDPVQSEVNLQVASLKGPNARVNMAVAFLNSQEFRVGTGPRLISFLLYATLLLRDGQTVERSLVNSRLGQSVAIKDIIADIVNGPEFNSVLN